jgi:hypothetical protein
MWRPFGYCGAGAPASSSSLVRIRWISSSAVPSSTNQNGHFLTFSCEPSAVCRAGSRRAGHCCRTIPNTRRPGGAPRLLGSRNAPAARSRQAPGRRGGPRKAHPSCECELLRPCNTREHELRAPAGIAGGCNASPSARSESRPEPLLLVVVGVHQCPGGPLDPAQQEGGPPVEVRVERQLVRPVSLGPAARSQESWMSPSGKTIWENASSR